MISSTAKRTPMQNKYCWFYMIPKGYKPMIRCVWDDGYILTNEYHLFKRIIPRRYIRKHEDMLKLADPFTVMFGTQVMLRIADPEEVSIVCKAILLNEKDEVDYSRDQLPF